MKRRSFLTGLALLPALSLPSLPAYAEESDLTFGVFPGTGTADLPLEELRAAIVPFTQAMAGSLGLEPKLTLFRTIKSVTRSLEKGRMDLYFVPPTVAVDVLDNGYAAIARVKDPLTGALVRVKGATVTTVAMAERNPQTIQTMQKVFVSKIAGFVIDKEADYKTLKQAIRDAGY